MDGVEFTYEWEPILRPEDDLRRLRVQMWAEQRLVEQVRAMQSDPRAFVKITGV